MVIFISNRSSPVTVYRGQFREHILNVIKGSFAQIARTTLKDRH